MADGRRRVGGLQDTEQHVVRDRVAAEAVTDVAALAHDAQDGLALGVVVAGSGRAREVAGRGRQRLGRRVRHVLEGGVGLAGGGDEGLRLSLHERLLRLRHGLGGLGSGLRLRLGRDGGLDDGVGEHGRDLGGRLERLGCLVRRGGPGELSRLGDLSHLGGFRGFVRRLRLVRRVRFVHRVRRVVDRVRFVCLGYHVDFVCFLRLGDLVRVGCFGGLVDEDGGRGGGRHRFGQLGRGLGQRWHDHVLRRRRRQVRRGGDRPLDGHELAERLRRLVRRTLGGSLREVLALNRLGRHGELAGVRVDGQFNGVRGHLLMPCVGGHRLGLHRELRVLGALRRELHTVRGGGVVDGVLGRRGLLLGEQHTVGSRRVHRHLLRDGELRGHRALRRLLGLHGVRVLHVLQMLLMLLMLGRLGEHGGVADGPPRRGGRCDGSGVRDDRFCCDLWGELLCDLCGGCLEALLRSLCAPGSGALRRDLTGLRHRGARLVARDVEVLGLRGGRARLTYRHGVRRCVRGAPVGERTDRAARAVRHRRTHVQRTTRGPGVRGGRGPRHSDAVQVDLAAVPARRLVRARLVRGGHRGGLRLAPGALRTRHQQQIVVFGGGFGGVEEGVRTRGGDARLFHRACVLRQPLARNLAGVGHAYPSPIG